jgi:acid-sensing ion channel, other
LLVRFEADLRLCGLTLSSVYRNCSCVPFYLMRDQSMNLCNIQEMECFYPFLRTSLDEFEHFFETDGVCKCLPSCNSIEYKFQIISNDNDDYKHNEGDVEASFEFRYKDGDYFPMIRYQEFKTKDFLSYVGGLLGLFAGISVLSIIEFIYFFTLRVFSDLLRFRKSSQALS